MFVTVVPDRLAHQLQFITWHVGYNFTGPASMSVRVASHQQICLNQMQLTCKHISICGAEPAGIYVTLASDPPLCPYALTKRTGW